MKDTPKTRRKFPRDFKIRIVQEIEGGKAVAEIAREYEIHEVQLYKWQREYRRSPLEAFIRGTGKSKEAQKLAEMERTIGRLHMENDILKKATGILEERLNLYRKQKSVIP